MGSEVWSISQFHSAPHPLAFTVNFNFNFNQFTIIYQNINIASFPNRFNIDNANDIVVSTIPRYLLLKYLYHNHLNHK